MFHLVSIYILSLIQNLYFQNLRFLFLHHFLRPFSHLKHHISTHIQLHFLKQKSKSAYATTQSKSTHFPSMLLPKCGEILSALTRLKTPPGRRKRRQRKSMKGARSNGRWFRLMGNRSTHADKPPTPPTLTPRAIASAWGDVVRRRGRGLNQKQHIIKSQYTEKNRKTWEKAKSGCNTCLQEMRIEIQEQLSTSKNDKCLQSGN